jgi:hypothetical protein
MLETYFSAAKMLEHLRSGPSGPYLDGFAEALERQGGPPHGRILAKGGVHKSRFSHSLLGTSDEFKLACLGRRQKTPGGLRLR